MSTNYNFNIGGMLEMLNLSTTQHNGSQRNTTQLNSTDKHNSDTTDRNTTQQNKTNTTQRNTTDRNTTQHNATQHNRKKKNKKQKRRTYAKQTCRGNVELDKKLHRKKRSKNAAGIALSFQGTHQLLLPTVELVCFVDCR